MLSGFQHVRLRNAGGSIAMDVMQEPMNEEQVGGKLEIGMGKGPGFFFDGEQQILAEVLFRLAANI